MVIRVVRVFVMMMMMMMMMCLCTPLARTPLPFPRIINPSVNQSLHFGIAVRMPMIKICKPFSPISVADFLFPPIVVAAFANMPGSTTMIMMMRVMMLMVV